MAGIKRNIQEMYSSHNGNGNSVNSLINAGNGNDLNENLMNTNSNEAKKTRLDNNNQQQMLTKQDPSRVVHLRNIPHQLSENEIIYLGLAFGNITNVLFLRSKSQAFLEFENLNDAQQMIAHFNSNAALQFNGKKIFVQYSNHHELNTDPSNTNNLIAQAALNDAIQLHQASKMGGKNTVLRATILNMMYPVTLEVLHQIFSKFGHVLKIITFSKNDKFQVLIQMKDPMVAQNAKMQLHGQNIYNGCCTLQIDFSKLTTLEVRFNNDKSRDFCNPLLPSGDGQPNSIGGGGAGPGANGNSVGGGGNANNNSMMGNQMDQSGGGGGGMQHMGGGMNGSQSSMSNQYQMGLIGNPPGSGGGGGGAGAGGFGMANSNSQMSFNSQGGSQQQSHHHPHHHQHHHMSSNVNSNHQLSNSNSMNLNNANGGGGGMVPPQGNPNITTPVLLISNLNEDLVTPEALFTLFGVYGDVLRVKILFNKKDSALINFANTQQAATALANLDRCKLWNKQIRVFPSKHITVQMPKDGQPDSGLTKDFSNSPLHRFKKPGSKNFNNIFPPSQTLHLSNIPPNVQEQELRELFSIYGQVRGFKFFQKDRKMALIQMDTVEEAITALIATHNYQLADNMHLRCTFSKATI